MHWMLMPFRRYAEFSGRSRRREFWMFQLLALGVALVVYGLMAAGGGLDFVAAASTGQTADLAGASLGPLFWLGCILAALWALGTIIPSLALTVRRLHDRNLSGWYLLGFVVLIIVLDAVPVVGQPLILLLQLGFLVLMVLPGTPGPNKYGPDPLGRGDAEVFA